MTSAADLRLYSLKNPFLPALLNPKMNAWALLYSPYKLYWAHSYNICQRKMLFTLWLPGVVYWMSFLALSARTLILEEYTLRSSNVWGFHLHYENEVFHWRITTDKLNTSAIGSPACASLRQLQMQQQKQAWICRGRGKVTGLQLASYYKSRSVCVCVSVSVCLCAPDTATGTFRLGLQ